jgi:hypothetical protein
MLTTEQIIALIQTTLDSEPGRLVGPNGPVTAGKNVLRAIIDEARKDVDSVSADGGRDVQG